jgi:hypothetical protein
VGTERLSSYKLDAVARHFVGDAKVDSGLPWRRATVRKSFSR